MAICIVVFPPLLKPKKGNQVKLIINYSIGDESIVGQKINAVMGIYDRINGTLIKLSSFPDGYILNNTVGTIQLASTLTDPKIQNISTIVTLTNAEKSEKYSNDVRSDLDLRAILPRDHHAINRHRHTESDDSMLSWLIGIYIKLLVWHKSITGNAQI